MAEGGGPISELPTIPKQFGTVEVCAAAAREGMDAVVCAISGSSAAAARRRASAAGFPSALLRCILGVAARYCSARTVLL